MKKKWRWKKNEWDTQFVNYNMPVLNGKKLPQTLHFEGENGKTTEVKNVKKLYWIGVELALESPFGTCAVN